MDIHELVEKSKVFALKIIFLHRYLVDSKSEQVLSRKLLESATAIGLHLRELTHDPPKADFRAALKAAEESSYWLELLLGSNYLQKDQFGAIYPECTEIVFELMALAKSQKKTK